MRYFLCLCFLIISNTSFASHGNSNLCEVEPNSVECTMHDGEKSGDNNTLILGLALVGTYYYFNNHTNSEMNYDNGIPLYKNKTIQINLLPKSKNLTMSEPIVSLTQEKYSFDLISFSFSLD